MPSNLGQLIEEAEKIKPTWGQACNHCGWCCLTEVCQMGEYHGASCVIPCEFLRATEQGQMCGLMLDGIMEPSVMGDGHCDAETQREAFQRIVSCQQTA